MSSNIRIEKQCEYCGVSFIAKMTTTRYCSHICNSRHYKANKRAEKIRAAEVQYKQRDNNLKGASQQELDQKPYLSMKEASVLLGVHERTIMNMKKRGALRYMSIGRRILIKREDLQAAIR